MDIIAEVINTIANMFAEDSDLEFYRNNQEQGFSEPCFFVRSIRNAGKEQLFGYQMRERLIAIRYFPRRFEENEADRAIEQCEVIGERLMHEFRYVGDHVCKVFDPSYEVTDGVLDFRFYAKYRTLPTKKESKTMQTLTKEVRL